MALQDLTPQLRTRLSRMERAVGWFVIIAALMLAAGFAYYVYHIAQRKGWFLKKITYQTCVSSAAGLKIGDPVKLMGYDAGQITEVIPNDPREYYNITINFRIKVDQYNYQGYIWSDSKVKVNSSDLLGGRYLEITKGLAGVPTILMTTNHEIAGVLRRDFQQVQKQRLKELRDQEDKAAKTEGYVRKREDQLLAQVLEELNEAARSHPSTYYTNHLRENIYFLDPIESAAVSDRLDKLVTQVETALPHILGLTNQIAAVLANSALLTSNLNAVAANVRPTVSNLNLATAQLNQPGTLGEWLLPTNINQKLDAVLAGADAVMAGANTNLEDLNLSLLNLANLTSNLNQQVQMNTNILGGISQAVRDADDLVQGLKRHWLLRSAFKTKQTNAPSAGASRPPVSPKAKSLR